MPLANWIRSTLLTRQLIAPADLDIWHCTDELDEAMQIIREAGERVEGGG